MGQSEKIMSIFEEYDQNIIEKQGAETQPPKGDPKPKATERPKTAKKTIRTPKEELAKDKMVYYKTLRKKTKKYYRELRRQTKKNLAEQKRLTRKRAKKVDKLSKQISKAVEKKVDKEYKLKKPDNITYMRFTEPKEKRGLLSRIRNRSRYDRGDFDYIEENIENGYITPETIASGEVTKKEWRELQRYEDAREDLSIKKGWSRFKLTLLAIALTGALFACKTAVDRVNETFDAYRQPTQVESIMELDQDERADVEMQALSFQSEVTQRDGYVFDYLSQQEIAEGYFKLVNYEERLIENQFNNSSLLMRDQEFLDGLVQKAYGEEAYSTFTPEQRREYRQLAFETLFVSHPDHFNEDSIDYIRNPIVIDHLNARDAAEEKGFDMKLTVNNSEKETVRNLGTLLHLCRTTSASDFTGILEDGGKSFLENMVMGVLGDTYETLNKDEQKTYIQVAYEMLPDEVKGSYVQDPIDIERAEAERNIDNNDDYER